MLGHEVNETTFSVYVLTDEAYIRSEDAFHFYDNHEWHLNNSHALHQRGCQQRYGINVWVGVVHNHMNTGNFSHRKWVQNIPSGSTSWIVRQIPLAIRRRMWFQK